MCGFLVIVSSFTEREVAGKSRTKPKGHAVSRFILLFRPVFHPKGEIDIVVDFGFFDLTKGSTVDEVLQGLEVVVLERTRAVRRKHMTYPGCDKRLFSMKLEGHTHRRF